jgi:hypothetical protein
VTAPPIPLDLAPDQRCRMGHDWRHVETIWIADQKLLAAGTIVRTRKEQDPIICARCGLFSLKASTPRAQEASP